MIPTQRIFIEPRKEIWFDLLKRPQIETQQLEGTVSAILDDVKKRGDDAIKEYTYKFDKRTLSELQVGREAIQSSEGEISTALKDAIQLAASNIRKFHEAQRENFQKIETSAGVFCWRKAVPIQRVGLYIPGGSAPLFSTLLMLAIPAKIAGCTGISVFTPAGENGKVNSAILYCASLLGLEKIYSVGGVQAIGAMAYGTTSIEAVNKIFGPGNQYVTCAKQLVSREGVAIDMPAGPSEVAIYADESSVPAFIAADLLSQAEHGKDSQVLLVCSSQEIITNVQAEIAKQLKLLPRADTALAALRHSNIIVLQDPATAFDLLNTYAPEHLIIASARAAELSEGVINAGSVFLGNYSPEAAGDYASGTNHTLPTNGYAAAYSGVSVDSFVKKITFQELSKEGLLAISGAVETMAAAEGLTAHKNAISIRLKEQQ